MKTLDAVVPVFNEESILPELHRRLTSALESMPYLWRIIYVDDGSRDRSAELTAGFADADSRVCVVQLSRNFGQQLAIAAGLAVTSAEGVVLLDGDLQDPPEVIPRLAEKWEDGCDVVYAIKRKRKEGWPKRALFSLFYLILQRLSSLEIPANAGNFSLMDRSVVDLINRMPERDRYVSGLRAYVGGKQVGVEFERGARYAGSPPLRLATILGFVVSGVAFVVLLNVLYARLVSGRAILGWASVMTSILFLGGIQLLAVGVIGEYIGRIYNETKGRPAWVVARYLNLEADASDSVAPTLGRRERTEGP